MKKAPEQYRLKKHAQLGSDASYGNNGFFVIPHYKVDNYFINCMVSDGMDWDHVSVTITSTARRVDRCPTWEEMCFVKDIFFDETETVLQYHPPKSENVSTHPYCLHLWRKQDMDIPLPDSLMVGIPGSNVQSF